MKGRVAGEIGIVSRQRQHARAGLHKIPASRKLAGDRDRLVGIGGQFVPLVVHIPTDGQRPHGGAEGLVRREVQVEPQGFGQREFRGDPLRSDLRRRDLDLSGAEVELVGVPHPEVGETRICGFIA